MYKVAWLQNKTYNSVSAFVAFNLAPYLDPFPWSTIAEYMGLVSPSWQWWGPIWNLNFGFSGGQLPIDLKSPHLASQSALCIYSVAYTLHQTIPNMPRSIINSKPPCRTWEHASCPGWIVNECSPVQRACKGLHGSQAYVLPWHQFTWKKTCCHTAYSGYSQRNGFLLLYRPPSIPHSVSLLRPEMLIIPGCGHSRFYVINQVIYHGSFGSFFWAGFFLPFFLRVSERECRAGMTLLGNPEGPQPTSLAYVPLHRKGVWRNGL